MRYSVIGERYATCNLHWYHTKTIHFAPILGEVSVIDA